MKAKDEIEKVGLKLNIQKTKIMAAGPITSWQIDGEKVETLSDFIFLGSKITADSDCSHKIKRHLLLGRISSVTQSCLTLWDPMNCSTPGLPVHYQIPESTQGHVHWVSDAIQSAHPLSSHSPPALNLSQHQGLVNESALRIRWPKYWSFSFSISSSNKYSGLISLGLTGLIFLHPKGLSWVFSNTTDQKNQFFGAQLSLWSNSHIHTWLLEKP